MADQPDSTDKEKAEAIGRACANEDIRPAVVQEFRAKLLGLLNSDWPHRSETDDDTAKRAAALAAQLRNWESWK